MIHALKKGSLSQLALFNLIIVFLIFAISYAAVTTIASSWRKKKNPQEIKKTILLGWNIKGPIHTLIHCN